MSEQAPPLDWNRLAALRPRLAADARIHRHCYRGVPWYVVQDGASARHVRLDAGAWRIAGMMDGERTLDAIHQALGSSLGEAGPSRVVVARVLGELHAGDLVECEALTSTDDTSDRQRHERRQRWRRALASPLSQRFALLDPQEWLNGWLPLTKQVVGPVGLAMWLALVLLGLGMALTHHETLVTGLFTGVLRPHDIALLVASFLVVKVLHELGHALVARAYGGEVHEMGIILLVLMPVPYVDASASTAFPEKGRRMAVGAAGIMVEVALAVIALAVWLSVEPGLVRDLARNVMLVGGISTLVFNGNPLLRFDGYYVACDALEIPNLAPRSARYLGYLVQRYLCGAQGAESPVSAAGERFWFVVYGIAAPLYRIAVLAAIVLLVAREVPVIGVLIGTWAVTGVLVLPAARGLARLLGAPALSGRRRRAALVLGGPAAAVLVGAFTVPLPAWTHAEGVVWLPERAQIPAGADGFLVRRVATPGDDVGAGDLVFALEAPELRTAVTVLEHRLEEHQARHDDALFNDRSRLEVLGEQLGRIRAELDSARRAAADLLARSPHDGTLIIPGARRQPGRFVQKGEVLGYVVGSEPLETRVVLRQTEIDRVRADTLAVRVKLPGHLERTLVARLDRAIPAATQELPGAALGAHGGGRIAVEAHDPRGRTSAQSVFVVSVTLPRDAPRAPLGTRVFVRFVHASAPLAAQLARATRQLLQVQLGA